METILVIDDEKSILDLLGVVFQKEGYRVKTLIPTAKIRETLDREDFDLVICDIKMPAVDGMEILEYLKKTNSDVPVILITAYGSVKQAVDALKAGARDYIVKPFDIEELKIIVSQSLEKKRLKEENMFLRKKLREKDRFENMIGKSRAMSDIFALIEKVAATDSTVLIAGESGTGKEMAARAIHILSRRKEGPFFSVNCGALPESLLESELFGHTRGSFTGAVAEKKGLFEAAHTGTLFLDEIAETSPAMQVKLLRALQEKKIRRVGGTDEIPVDVRTIAATNQDLKKKIKDGAFREELYYRLNVISFEMPPLRKRIEDIPLLVTHFLQKHCQQMGRKIKRISPEVIDALESYSWPGNVRELENLIERIVAIEERETIILQNLPQEIFSPSLREESGPSLKPGFKLMAYMDDLSKKYICEARAASDGNMRKMASLLGISYRSLRYLLNKYNLKPKKAPEPYDSGSQGGRKEEKVYVRNMPKNGIL